MMRWTTLLSLSMVVFLMGCASQEINTTYGRRRGRSRPSVNGTSVLAEMFRQAGYKVTTWSRLSPRLKRSKVIIWTPNSFELPSGDEIDHLENWLANDRNRTLVYVARDYDAAIEYWRLLAGQSEGQSFIDRRRQLARAQAEHALLRSYTGKALDCEWFSMDSLSGFIPVTPNGPWAENIDSENTNIVVAGRLNFPKVENVQRSTMLGSDDGQLVVQVTSDPWGDNSQLIIVINGSCLFNLPLINHEHRKIAGNLIDACGTAGRVTFLESGPSAIPISDKDPRAYTGFEAFTVWPISSILMHLTIAGILYCVMVYPIFGKPWDVPDETPSDFGKHIRAMGELLALVNDRSAALAQVRQYRQLTTDTVTSDGQESSGNPFQNPTETFTA